MNTVNELSVKKTKVIVWGAGSAFSRLYPRASFSFDLLVDSDPVKWGKLLYGHRVYDPSILVDAARNANLVVFIYSTYYESVRKDARKLGVFACVDAVSSVLRLSRESELKPMFKALPLVKGQTVSIVP